MGVVNSPLTEDQVDVRPTPEEPIDYAVVREVARATEALVLATTNRPALNQYEEILTEVVRRLIREDYPDQTAATISVFRTAYRVVDAPTKPTGNDSDYKMYSHVKNLARTAASLADVLDPQPEPAQGGEL